MLQHGGHGYSGCPVANADADGYAATKLHANGHAATKLHADGHAKAQSYPHANTDTYTGVLPQFHDGRRVRCT
jgi:hypothetical protein